MPGRKGEKKRKPVVSLLDLQLKKKDPENQEDEKITEVAGEANITSHFEFASGGKTRRRSSARKHNKSKKHHKKSKKHHKKHHNKKSKKHRKK